MNGPALNIMRCRSVTAVRNRDLRVHGGPDGQNSPPEDEHAHPLFGCEPALVVVRTSKCHGSCRGSMESVESEDRLPEVSAELTAPVRTRNATTIHANTARTLWRPRFRAMDHRTALR